MTNDTRSWPGPVKKPSSQNNQSHTCKTTAFLSAADNIWSTQILPCSDRDIHPPTLKCTHRLPIGKCKKRNLRQRFPLTCITLNACSRPLTSEYSHFFPCLINSCAWWGTVHIKTTVKRSASMNCPTDYHLAVDDFPCYNTITLPNKCTDRRFSKATTVQRFKIIITFTQSQESGVPGKERARW